MRFDEKFDEKLADACDGRIPRLSFDGLTAELTRQAGCRRRKSTNQ